MKGKLTISHDEVLEMARVFLKVNAFGHSGSPRIVSISAKYYGSLEIDVEFTDEPLPCEPDPGDQGKEEPDGDKTDRTDS